MENAVKLMYTGAAVSTVSLISLPGRYRRHEVRDQEGAAQPHRAQVNQLNTFIISLAIISGLVGIALWLWMARANGQGRNWAPILSSVLFGLATLDLFGVITQPKTVLGLVFPVLTWLLGLGAVVLLWRPDSTAFFRPRSRVSSAPVVFSAVPTLFDPTANSTWRQPRPVYASGRPAGRAFRGRRHR